MFSEMVMGFLKLWWAWMPFIAVMVGGMIYESRHADID